MKILLTSIGTTGDIEPFLALGEILGGRGHEIIYSFPVQFEPLLAKRENFHPLSKKVIELIESEDGRTIMGKASWWKKLRALIRLYKSSQLVNKLLMNQQYEIIKTVSPDLIIHNVKCNYALIWGLRYSKPTVLVSPVPYFMYYVDGHPHIGFNKDFGIFINKLTYKLANFGLIKTLYDSQKHLPQTTSFTKQEIRKALFTKRLIYTISPTIFERPDTWPKNVQVLGYHNRDKMNNWTPDTAILDFIKEHDKIVFLTFGSMVNSEPESNSRILLKVLSELHIPTIVNIASGGLRQIEEFDSKGILFVEQIPYDWILDKVYAIIHHGGSGTTHLSMKHGCPCLIVPHIIDQFGWNNLVSSLGIGPKGISINKLSSKKLRPVIQDLYENTKYELKAKTLSSQIQHELMEEKLCDFILREESATFL